MWTFIPRLPGKEQWQKRPFEKCESLYEIVDMLNTFRPSARGILELKGMKSLDELTLSNEQWMIESVLQVPFRNISELELHIKNYKKTSLPMSRIHVIYIYDLGYFIQ